jgi:hypothetical protein
VLQDQDDVAGQGDAHVAEIFLKVVGTVIKGLLLWSQFSAILPKKCVFIFFKCYDANLEKNSSILDKKTPIFCQIFCENISKIITSVTDVIDTNQLILPKILPQIASH